jgi:hypothetical protein
VVFSEEFRRKPVILSPSEIQRALSQAQAAFPHFSHWEHHNEVDESYSGFALWGEFVHDPGGPSPSSFFITFNTPGATWTGHLSIGQHCYFWSSADCDDALLVGTEARTNLDDAIVSLKRRIADLFLAFLGSAA